MKRFCLIVLVFLSAPFTASGASNTKFKLIDTFIGFRTYAMRVTGDTDWFQSNLSINLYSGTLKHVEAPAFLGGGTAPVAGIQGARDTAVFSPLFTLGDISGGFIPANVLSGTFSENPNSFEATWYNTDTNDIGVFDIAFVTISKDAAGTVDFNNYTIGHVEVGSPSTNIGQAWFINNGRFHRFPEPGSLALIGIGMVGLLGTRRNKN